MLSQLALHPQGPQCSRLALGIWRLTEWQLDTHSLVERLETCLELGITTIDHADIYGDYTCETQFGLALKASPMLRSRLQLVGKCGIKLVSANRPAHTIKHYDTRAAHILESVHHSLRSLHTDYLDVLLLHRPDPLMDADEVAQAFTLLRQAGKVRHFGVSNFTPSQVELLAARLEFPLVTNQIEISVLHLAAFQDGTLEQCQRSRMAAMAWSPLAGGRLLSSPEEPAQRVRQTLIQIGQSLDATPEQVAIAWLLMHPARILPIIGTGNLERLRAIVAAESLSLTREQWFTIWSAAIGGDVP